LKRKGIFSPSDAEKKQLEEIAHLYFSSPAPASKESKHPPETEPTLQPPSRTPPSVVVYCAAVEKRASLASVFLYNLALLLKISEDSVLLVCANDTYRRRFSFAFRPDREQRILVGGKAPSRGIVGPLGLRLLDADCLEDRHLPLTETPEGNVHPQDLPFQFILTDHPATTPCSHDSGAIVLFLVTPETPADAFCEWRTGVWSRNTSGPVHAGIVTAEVTGREEAAGLYAQWKGKLGTLLPEACRVESYGMFPVANGGEAFRIEGEMGVLEHPTSWVTRCCLETAALIRRRGKSIKGRESSNPETDVSGDEEVQEGGGITLQQIMQTQGVVRIPGAEDGNGDSKEDLLGLVVESPVFQEAGLTTVSCTSLGKDPRYPQFLIKNSQGRLFLLDALLKKEKRGVPDILMMQYRFLREHITWIVEFLKAAGSDGHHDLCEEPPGLILVTDMAQGPMEYILGLPTEISLDVYTLRYEDPDKENETLTEPWGSYHPAS